jgi:hypothetical protein
MRPEVDPEEDPAGEPITSLAESLQRLHNRVKDFRRLLETITKLKEQYN